jgi:hypothetical protein
VLPCFHKLLTSLRKGVRKETCWALSNITAGNQQQIQQVMDAGIMPELIKLLSAREFDVKKESAWTISNATSGGTDEQIRRMVQWTVIPPLCQLFECEDPNLITGE